MIARSLALYIPLSAGLAVLSLRFWYMKPTGWQVTLMCRLHVRSLTRSKNPSTSYYLLRNHNPTLCIPSINFLQLPVWMDDNPVFCLWTTFYYLFQIFLDFFHSTLEFLEYLSFLNWIYSIMLFKLESSFYFHDVVDAFWAIKAPSRSFFVWGDAETDSGV